MAPAPYRTLPGAASAQEPRRSAADAVFELLHARILSLDLPPGARLSEAEVATETGVSRQPVRDAFYRLSRQGFLTIRPQVATTVAPISVRQVREAQFLRKALELEIVRTVCAKITAPELARLDGILQRQAENSGKEARAEFHRLDDEFHRELAGIAGHGHAWELIRDLKAHMDRVRYLTLVWSAPAALAEHRAILSAIENRDVPAAEAGMRAHLGRILEHVDTVRAEHGLLFGDEDG